MNTSQLQIPIAIIIAGAITAGAIIFGGGSTTAGNTQQPQAQQGDHFANNNSETAKNVRPVDTNIDHIFGNPDAKVKIIEYSDFECPFCSRMHPTLERVVEDFDGEVAWVYRHFPLSNIHSRATGAAVASECVAQLGGNDSFWSFADSMFENQRSLGNNFYIQTAIALGINETEFTACFNSGEVESKVSSDGQNAIQSGGRGTPFVIIIDENGNPFPFAGALPYEQVSLIVTQALNN